MRSGEQPPLDREAFVRHIARLSKWAEAMRELLVEEGITPPALPPTQDEIPESGAALQITMLRAELRQAGDLVQDGEQEIEQHEREILVLKDHLNEAENEVMELRRRLAIEPPPSAVAVELAQQQVAIASRGKKQGGRGSIPGVIRALGELGQATVQELEEHLMTTTASIKSSIYAYREKLAKTERPDGSVIYRLATAAAPAAAAQSASETLSADRVSTKTEKLHQSPQDATPVPARGAFDDLGGRILSFLRERGSAAAPMFIAERLKVDRLEVEAAIVVLEVGGAVERRDLGTIAQWRAVSRTTEQVA